MDNDELLKISTNIRSMNVESLHKATGMRRLEIGWFMQSNKDAWMTQADKLTALLESEGYRGPERTP